MCICGVKLLIYLTAEKNFIVELGFWIGWEAFITFLFVLQLVMKNSFFVRLQ